MSKKTEKIQKEIFRLIRLKDEFENFKRLYSDNNYQKLVRFLKSENLKYRIYSNDTYIILGNKVCIYSLNDDGSLSLKITNCSHSRFVQEFYSKKQDERFNDKIKELKLDFKNKGNIYSAFKKFHLKEKNEPTSIKSNQIPLSHRIDKNIKKYNKIIEKEIHGVIAVGKTYTKNIELRKGYYSYPKKLDYLKIVKENPKTYQIEYKFNSEDKVINKRMDKEKVQNIFVTPRKGLYEFREELNNLNNKK